MSERIVGFIVIGIGILIMIVVSLNIYGVFTLRTSPISLFHLPAISLDMSQFVGSNVPQEQIDQLKSQGKLTTELISSDVLNQPLNLVAHIILMGFFLNVGYKVASLGVQLVRPIKVNLKELPDKT